MAYFIALFPANCILFLSTLKNLNNLLDSVCDSVWQRQISPEIRVSDEKKCQAQRKHTDLFIMEYVALWDFTHTILAQILQLISASP